MDENEPDKHTLKPLTSSEGYKRKIPKALPTSQYSRKNPIKPLKSTGEPYQTNITRRPKPAKLRVLFSPSPLNPALFDGLLGSFFCWAESLILEIALSVDS